jgi:peptidoglycan/xylan/chitin deacetylase (PgdA/CDA1 family)
MLSQENLVPALPDGTLALTFDDGPGPHSLPIGHFLHEQGIRATFFVVGRSIRETPKILSELQALGHAIGNHTDTHPRLPLLDTAEAVKREVAETHRLIEASGCQPPHLLRAPYGYWTAGLAAILNTDPELSRYSGPFGWSVENLDYRIGLPRDPKVMDSPIHTFESCCESYLKQVREKRQGVVLIHDWAADPEPKLRKQLRAGNRSLEITRWLIPRIKSDFKFVRLDELPAPTARFAPAAAPPLPAPAIQPGQAWANLARLPT